MIEISEFLAACGEPEMADAVENMHNRLEAFADGLDRDCREAQSRAFEEVTTQRDNLLASLKECRTMLEHLGFTYEERMAVIERANQAIEHIGQPGEPCRQDSAKNETQARLSLPRETQITESEGGELE